MNSWMKTTRIKKYRKSRHRYRDIVMVKEKPIDCLVLTDVYSWNSFFSFIIIYFTKFKINFIIIGLLNAEKNEVNFYNLIKKKVFAYEIVLLYCDILEENYLFDKARDDSYSYNELKQSKIKMKVSLEKTYNV